MIGCLTCMRILPGMTIWLPASTAPADQAAGRPFDVVIGRHLR